MTDATPKRAGRMNRSRWIAAGTSVGALVALTAGVAAANPAPNGTSSKTGGTHPATGTGTASTVPGSDDARDDDSGWVPADPGTQGTTSDPGVTGPSAASGWNDPGFADPNAGSNAGGFNPGTGSGGRTSSGGS